MVKLNANEFVCLTAMIRSNPNRTWDNFAKMIEGKTDEELVKMCKEANNG